jgi:hypothetical protein
MGERTDGPPDRVRVLVAHDRNRELLAEWLGDTYEVVTGVDEGTAASEGGDGGEEGPLDGTDLCLVDPEGFAAHRERLRSWKDRVDPVFAPVVLVIVGVLPAPWADRRD